jgi:hypothetical protein
VAHEYNTYRPHSSLGMATPAVFAAQHRRWNRKTVTLDPSPVLAGALSTTSRPDQHHPLSQWVDRSTGSGQMIRRLLSLCQDPPVVVIGPWIGGDFLLAFNHALLANPMGVQARAGQLVY